MRDSHLVFVEGIMGSGKSSTATFVALQLQWNRLRMRYVFEGEWPHPTKLADHMTAPRTAAEYMDKSLASWRLFVEGLPPDAPVHVFDGQLFHGDFSEIMFMGADEAELAAYAEELGRIVAGLNPCLVYLYQDDVEAAVKKVCAERGPGWRDHQIEWKVGTPYCRRRGMEGIGGLVGLYRAYRRLTDGLAESWPFAKITLENSAGAWPGYCRRIMDFLELEHRRPETVVDDNDLSKVFADADAELVFANSTEDIIEVFRLGCGEARAEFYIAVFPGEEAACRARLGSFFQVRRRHGGRVLQTAFAVGDGQRVSV